MARVFVIDGLTFRIHFRDYRPPHIHVTKGTKSAVIGLLPPFDVVSSSLDKNDLTTAILHLERLSDYLMAAWEIPERPEDYNYSYTTPDSVFFAKADYPYVYVRFGDETTATFDFTELMEQGIYFPVLKDKEMFDKMGLNTGSVYWPWALDYAPDTMYLMAQEAAPGEIIML